jgi:hypothetical protein
MMLEENYLTFSILKTIVFNAIITNSIFYMYSSIASKKRSSKTEDLNLSTIGINRSFSMINKVDNPIEWYEIKTPSTLVSRRTLHSSCLH